MTTTPRKMPAFVNTASGTAAAALAALAENGAFDVRTVGPTQLQEAVRGAVSEGAPRVLVAGGDGTIGTAASVLLGTDTELALLPGGTLNHFARDLGFTDDARETLRIAREGVARAIDVGMVNNRLCLNTSSVGDYVRFIRIREYLERRHVGYRIASAIAAFVILFQFRRIVVKVSVDGNERVYRTALVFIGVGERELKLPTLGNRAPHGRAGLHVMVVSSRTRARSLAIGLSAVARGVKSVSKTPEFDSFLVDACTISRRHGGFVALDGELASLDAALEYELRRDALRVVCP